MASPFPEPGSVLWIADPSGLAILAEALASTRELALDTESNSMFAYRERVCLVQLGLVFDPASALSPAIAIIDPLAFEALGEALSVVVEWMAPGGDPARGPRVLMHGGEYDVAVLKRELGFAPTHLFDTQAAASMLGLTRTGYASLCDELLGITVDKEQQQTNWGKRPLSGAARSYAAADVLHLPPLARIIEARVRAADLEEEVAIACRAVTEASAHEAMDEDERYWRVIGSERLSPDERARLASLVAWREREAELRDQPPGMLVPKAALLTLARRAPTEASGLEGLGLSRRLLAESAEALIAAVHHPVAPPVRGPRERPNPVVDQRRSRLKTWREVEAQRRGVTVQVVLPTRALDALAAGERDLAAVPQLGDKRIRLYGEQLAKLIR
ncbi:MAG: HRDC domain-containing protein [Deltaproteobacteria bacterium]|nr:HRDC domain-containing protein [Deltaproteobacteria bacterium]